ncbi:MAG: insulinase family protein [Candidatus Coatesbacteria bacterium]|nr:insulinase family protein [Candidatus Coatesbacteria bacterium]
MIATHVLENGITLLCEPIEYVKSVSILVRVNTEPPTQWRREGGVRHFIEHLLFKGTKSRSALDIAKAIDSIGGALDAWTDHESTSFSAKVLDKHFDKGLEILSDLVTGPRFDENDISMERKVILDEILREMNDPGSNTIDQYMTDAWPNHPSGMLLIGTQRIISRMPRETIVSYYQENYVGRNMVVACCGNIEPSAFFEAAAKNFGNLPSDGGEDQSIFGPAEYVSQKKSYTRNFDHINLCLGVKGLPYKNPYRYEYAVLDTLLGGGVSSRLFQEIREKRGLCYSIISFSIKRRDAGLLAIHSACGKKSVKRLINLIVDELRRLVTDGVGVEEVNATKEHLKGSLMLALESTHARVMRLARGHIYFGKVFSLDEICAGVDVVSPDSVNSLVQLLFTDGDLGITMVGNMDDSIVNKIDLSLRK